jgi:5,10-methylenetetrahydromethanopterin reductase
VCVRARWPVAVKACTVSRREPGHFRPGGLGIYSTAPTRTVSKLAQAAERRGFRRLWLAEDYHTRSAVVQAAAAASATAELELAFGIVSPFARHPAVLGMEIATLEEQWGPRFVLGLGTARIALRAHGQETVPAIAGLREAGEICKRLLSGERVTYEGKVFRLPAPGVQLNVRPARRQIPIYLGALGPKGLSVAGAVADGVLFSVLCSPGFVRKGLAHVRTGAKGVGRSLEDIDVAATSSSRSTKMGKRRDGRPRNSSPVT